ncbi:MAG TPA: hypothetical protein VMS22_26125 [Candidatus Eisenbacteria bacterium]|nr:hypothetical protein [Candidatus Eisenbacteria bacterium]
MDPRGAVVAQAPRDVAAVLPATVVALSGETVYTRAGDVFAWACVLVALLPLGRRRATPPPAAGAE